MTEFVSALKVKSQNKTYSKATADKLHGHKLYKPESSLATWVHKSTSTHISMLCYQHLLTNHNNESNAPLLPWQMQLKVNGKPIKEYLYLGIVHKNKTKSRAKIYKSQYILRYNMPSVLWCCWLGGRKGIRLVKKQSGGVLVWLSVWSKVQTYIWPSWCYCHSLSLASVKSRLVLPFWYRLTWVVLEKGPLNGCVCVFQLVI